MRITAIEKQQRRRRANVYVDGRFALALGLEVIAEAGLRAGDEISASRLEVLRQADVRQGALNAALRLLSYRPRSQAEIRSRLARRGLPAAIIDATLERLQSLGLVDDVQFARYWVETRNQSSPRGRRLLAQELRLKGVEREVVGEALAPLSEEDAAYRAASRRAKALKNSDYSTFRRKLADYLLRRGFSLEVVLATVGGLWREVGSPTEEPGNEE